MIINGAYFEDPSCYGLPGSETGGCEHLRVGGSIVNSEKIQGPITAEEKFIEYANGDAGPECCEQWYRDICTFIEHRHTILDALRKIRACGGANEQAHWQDVVEANKALEDILALIDPPTAIIPVCGSADESPNAKLTGPETSPIHTNQRESGSGEAAGWVAGKS